jgi:hypothetical protein
MLSKPLSDCCQRPPLQPLSDDGIGQCCWCLFWLDKDEWIEMESDSEKASVGVIRREWASLCERSKKAVRDFKDKNNNTGRIL